MNNRSQVVHVLAFVLFTTAMATPLPSRAQEAGDTDGGADPATAPYAKPAPVEPPPPSSGCR